MLKLSQNFQNLFQKFSPFPNAPEILPLVDNAQIKAKMYKMQLQASQIYNEQYKVLQVREEAN